MYPEKLLAVLVKNEATSGVDAVPTGTDAVRPVGIPTFTPGYLEPGLRDDVVLGTHGSIGRTAPAGRIGTVQITTEVRGRGSAYGAGTGPEANALLVSSAMQAALGGGAGTEKIEYFSVDTGYSTCTVYAYAAGKLIKLVGCVVDCVLAVDAMRRAFFQWTITGRMASDPTEAALPALTFNATEPPLFHSATATIGAWSSAAGADPLVLRTASIAWGNVIADRPSAGATDGLIGYQITDKKMKQTLGYEVPSLASHDAFALSKAVGAAQPFSTWQIGTTQYNRIKISTGRWAMEAPSFSQQNGLWLWNVTGNLVQGTETTRQRELLITFD